MLFSTPVFMFAFLPVTLVGYFLCVRFSGREIAMAWLVVASLFFYGWYEPAYLLLLLGSIAVNYLIGQKLSRTPSSFLLGVGVVGNLCLIGFYKYIDFVLATVFGLLDTRPIEFNPVLPLAISFFTLQQIAYLVDAQRGKVHDASIMHYVLFVTFFPQLIAGPIVHHKETIPQFKKAKTGRRSRDDFAIGTGIFLIGLYKKIVFADGIGIYANTVFDAAAAGQDPTLLVAWGGALAFTLQLYFDFSGYSDMAIGLARMFGIQLPLNFHSPYKAVNIIDFWRRWHITLSRFLRDYCYIALGGNQKGATRRYINIFVTMLIGGLWHGAAWTFVFWGGMHGMLIAINHAWHWIRRRLLGHNIAHSTRLGRSLSRSVTFLSVVVAWVFFRADGWDSAIAVLKGMMGLNGVALSKGLEASLGQGAQTLAELGVRFEAIAPFETTGFQSLVVLLLIVWFAPNTQELAGRHSPALDFDQTKPGIVTRLLQAKERSWALPTMTICLIVGSLILLARHDSPTFIYMVF